MRALSAIACLHHRLRHRRFALRDSPTPTASPQRLGGSFRPACRNAEKVRAEILGRSKTSCPRFRLGSSSFCWHGDTHTLANCKRPWRC